MRAESPALVAAALLSIGAATAQQEVEVDTGEIGLTHRLAPAPRALAMGVEGLALASEGSTLVPNPAGLTAIRRFELSAALAGSAHRAESRFFGREAEDEVVATTLSEAHFVLPVPTYRGGLAFAVGYHDARPALRSSLFDGFNSSRTALDGSPDPSREREQIHWHGGPAAFVAAAAIDLSPRTTIGFALDIWRGEERRSRRFELGFSGDDALDAPPEIVLEDDYTVEHSGLRPRAGLMIRAAAPLRIGIAVEAPFDLKRVGHFDETETLLDRSGNELARSSARFEVDEKIGLPWSIGVGAVLHLGRLALLSADGRWTDLPRLEHSVRDSTGAYAPTWPSLTDEPPYRMGLEAGGGVEVIVPGTALRARAGYRFVRPHYLRETALDGRHRLAAGLGWILDGTLSVDLAAALETTESEQFSGRYFERSTRTRLALGTAYRF